MQIEKLFFYIVPEYESDQYIKLNGKKYFLQQIHAHIPSEHTLNTKRYAIEWHFVHKNINNEIVVIASWGEIGKMTNSQYQIVKEEIHNNKESYFSLDIQKMLPDKKHFYAYEGSLTTPPTIEGVTWIILKDILVLDNAVFKSCNKISHNNNRPLQPCNHRKILER
ncbi:MAG: carbonic anhydrase family protein, partial [Coprobacillaceae bacterium]